MNNRNDAKQPTEQKVPPPAPAKSEQPNAGELSEAELEKASGGDGIKGSVTAMPKALPARAIPWV
jgi:hypothetical protein